MDVKVNVESYGSSLQCCVCVYNQARVLQAMRLLGKEANEEVGNHEPNHEKTAELLCNGCKMQRYCSVAHLTEDLEHRDFCRIFQDIQQVESIDHPLFLQGIVLSRTMLNQAISQLKLILSVKLRRPLSLREKEILANPGFCVICYRTTPLNVCAGCAGVAYCSENHRHLDKDNHTPNVCRTLALLYSPYRLLDYEFQIKEFHRSSIIPESHLVEAFYNATLLEVSDRPWKSLQQYDLFAACSSFSTIATVCLALTQISIVAEPDKAVIVYIVGATIRKCTKFGIVLYWKHAEAPGACGLDYLRGRSKENSCKTNYSFYVYTFFKDKQNRSDSDYHASTRFNRHRKHDQSSC
ncbi:uncharacterized protein LOC111075212 isoform X2 [Drosophila obscura]|uniref:uncharacterized protein LOC111075212 isoform X2 n=1 Tax=Drosophila obscura TaxID=7282 RepID=UPI001BB19B2D|nr:uncharacterized protein LOC111075212 isoform X2 [Drosophila obscura]